jgi:2-polyprenyl-3-methyl-5-hydroxy-6-metoxy-1,4-benzoquinol methylase
MQSADIKEFYRQYGDKIVSKRWQSKYVVRSYVHDQQYRSILKFVEPGMRVLDAGCGEAILSLMMAEKGAIVVGTDLSEPNIAVCQRRAAEAGLSGKVSFQLADSEHLPFADDSFDLVVSSHVLEHLPDFDQGLRELMRVTKKRTVAAIPTINNVCSWVQVGHGWFYLRGLRSFLGLPYGFLLYLWSAVTGREGVNETYGGAEVPHIFRFIRNMKKRVRKNGFTLKYYEASSICLPYFGVLLPVIKFLDRFRASPVLRNCGYGTTFLIEK